jgi:hypothetical protein
MLFYSSESGKKISVPNYWINRRIYDTFKYKYYNYELSNHYSNILIQVSIKSLICLSWQHKICFSMSMDAGIIKF